MKTVLILILLLSTCVGIASAEINVSGADMTYNATLSEADIQTPLQPVSFIFIYNDIGNVNSSLEPVQIPTVPMALSRIFSWNEVSKNTRSLEMGSIPTERKLLRHIFVVHEFAGFQDDLQYPKHLFNDTTPPKISDVTTDRTTSRQARINWSTDEYATSLVKFGGFPDEYDASKKENLYTQNHSIQLEELLPETKYYVGIISKDRSGNSAESQTSEFENSGP